MSNTESQASALAAVQTAFDADNTTIAAQAATITDLQRQIADLTPKPPPTDKSFRFSVTVGANDNRRPAGMPGGTVQSLQWSFNRVSPALQPGGFGRRVKFFGDAGIMDAAKMCAGWPGKEPEPHLTNEVWDPAALDKWMDSLTAIAEVCYLQEFMDKVGPGLMPWDTFNGRYADLRAQIDAHKNGKYVNLIFVGNEAIERKAASAGQPPVWKNVKVPERTGVGCDTYVTQAAMLVPSKGSAGSIGWFQAVKDIPGVRGIISEFGISRINFTPDQRVKALDDYCSVLANVGFSGLTYWATCNTDKDAAKDWSLDLPADIKVATKARDLIASTSLA